MPVLDRPWDPVRAEGGLAVVVAAAAPTNCMGRLSSDQYAWAERLGSHLRGRADRLIAGPEPGAALTARPVGEPEIEPLLGAPGRLRRGAMSARGALPVLYDLPRTHPTGGLVVLVVHPWVQAALVQAVAGERRRRAPFDPPTSCRTLGWTASGGWRVVPGAWMPA